MAPTERPLTPDEMLESIRAERRLLEVEEFKQAIERAESAKAIGTVGWLRIRYQQRFRIAFDFHAELVETLEAIRDTGCMPVELAHREAYRLFDRKGLTPASPGAGNA